MLPSVYTADPQAIKKRDDGFYEVSLKQGETVTFNCRALEQTNLTIQPSPVAEQHRNLFGFSKKTEHLPGHQFYKR